MRELARPKVRPPAIINKTKVLVVRQPVKSVRRSEEPDRRPFRLAMSVVTALGIAAFVWMLGYFGFRLGFAPTVRVPELTSQSGEGLVTGAMMLVALPRLIVEAGIAEPTFLMIGFFVIAIPATSLAVAKPLIPGGPKPHKLTTAFSYTGTVLCGLYTIGLIWWTVSPFRLERMRELPLTPREGEAWLLDLQMVAGLDALAFVAAALWAVLVVRLAVPLWLKGLTSSGAFFALVLVTVGMALSNGTATHVHAPRSMVFVADGSVSPRLLLGFTERQLATLEANPNGISVELLDRPVELTVIGRQSIASLLEEVAPEREFE